MINKKFEVYKLQREIKKSGVTFSVVRQKLNKFKEPIDNEVEKVCKINGLYHEQSSTIAVTTGETTQYRTKKLPAILCSYEDAKLLQQKDLIKLGSKTYKVTGIVDVQEWGLISDVFMEVIDSGR